MPSMKLAKQVVSRKFAQGLVDIGVKADSIFKWVGNEVWDETMQSDYETSRMKFPRSTWLPAWTVAELGDLLKHYDVTLPWYANGSWWWYQLDGSEWETKTEADARADLLHHLIKNNAPKV